jgi:hypothetical protein
LLCIKLYYFISLWFLLHISCEPINKNKTVFGVFNIYPQQPNLQSVRCLQTKNLGQSRLNKTIPKLDNQTCYIDSCTNHVELFYSLCQFLGIFFVEVIFLHSGRVYDWVGLNFRIFTESDYLSFCRRVRSY